MSFDPKRMQQVAQMFVSRAEHQGWGKAKRDTMALEFICGAAALDQINNAGITTGLSLAAAKWQSKVDKAKRA